MTTSTTQSIAVLSGKGGVGKSSIALNLGCALARLGHDTLLADCDMGLANIDILLGIAPQHHMQDIILNGIPIEDVLFSLNDLTNGNARFDLLPANSGISELAELDETSCSILCEQINTIAPTYKTIILDIGAGISRMALDFARRVDRRLLVVSPEPTSITDGYALMKVLCTEHNVRSFHVLVNMADSVAEAKDTFGRLALVCEKFLDFSPQYAGMIANDNAVSRAVIHQKPFIIDAPRSKAALHCSDLAEEVIIAHQQLHQIHNKMSALLRLPKELS